MIQLIEISSTFSSFNSIQFLIDDDQEMNWIGLFSNENFGRFFILIDKNVKRIWGKLLFSQLEKHNKKLYFLEVDPVEDSKSIEYYPTVISFFEEHQCNRFDLVIAIGGGIVIDLASFVVSTYMRGLPFYIIATTLIGQVDASTAGKTCLNTASSKNLLGTFYYPLKVYNNIHFLGTNSNRFMRQGFSEVFKYGLLGSKALIGKLIEYHDNNDQKILIDIIKHYWKKHNDC